jgi:hypothetical protein
MRHISIYIVTAFILLSCKPKQLVVAEQVAKEDNKSIEVIQKHYENKLVFETASIRTSASYEDAKQSLSINADLRIKKDEIIWINLKFLGFPAAKAFITPTRVSYYEKINNTYFDGDYSTLSKWLGTDLDFKKVQNLLLGRPIDNLTKEVFLMQIVDNLFQLKNKNTAQTQKTFSFESGNFLLKKQVVSQPVNQRSVTVTYPAYQNIETTFLPTGIQIEAIQKDAVKIDLEYKKITFNENLTYPYEVPNGYKQIIID